MNPKKIIIVTFLTAFLVIGIVLIFGWLVSNNQPIPIQQSKYIEISVDEKFERISNVQLPIDKAEAETIVKKFCESKNPDYSYGYDTIKEVGNEWRVQIVNMNGLCYAAVNIKNGETNCKKCDDVKLFPPFEQVTITTDKTEYEQGEAVEIVIQNQQNGRIDICCPKFCAAEAKFPTRIEKYEDGEWKFSIGYCPVLELLFEKPGVSENDFVCHALPIKNLFKLEIYDFYDFYEGHKIDKDERVRIIYYLGEEKIPVYSNEFTIKEKSALDPRCSEKVIGIGDCDAYHQGYEFDSATEKCIKKGVSGCSFGIPFETLEECQKVCENEIICRDENYKCTVKKIPCCSGLKEVLLSYEDENGQCFPPVPCGSICLPCGNGVCEGKENKCNCPEDCK